MAKRVLSPLMLWISSAECLFNFWIVNFPEVAKIYSDLYRSVVRGKDLNSYTRSTVCN
jgi:hypothetical protein